MTPFHPLISDDELLALVEQRPIPGGQPRKDAIRAILERDPDLVRLIRSLRQDQLALCELADDPAARAPSDLLTSLETRQEREALLGIAEPALALTPDTLPISAVQPVKASPWQIITRSPWTRPAALAAALALAITGVFALRSALTKPAAPRTTDPTLARNDLNAPTPNTSTTNATIATGTTTTTTATTASLTQDQLDAMFPLMGPSSALAIDALTTPPITDDPLLNPTGAGNTPALADASSIQRAQREQRLAQALEAAREGRLIIRLTPSLRPGAQDDLTRRLDLLASRTPVGVLSPRFARLTPADASALQGAIVAFYTPAPKSPSLPELPTNTPPRPDADRPFASGDPHASPSQPPLNLPAPINADPIAPAPTAAQPLQLHSVLSVSIPDSLDALRRLTHQLAEGGVTVQIDMLPAATSENAPHVARLPTPKATLDAQSILWWTAPESNLSPRLSIPLAVQQTPVPTR
ncbi:MAG: hypothetical protein IBJ18_07020 [Phycisphaerales bacterium]|nr:hypothetical protein [Phycisphaerales bacterium]